MSKYIPLKLKESTPDKKGAIRRIMDYILINILHKECEVILDLEHQLESRGEFPYMEWQNLFPSDVEGIRKIFSGLEERGDWPKAFFIPEDSLLYALMGGDGFAHYGLAPLIRKHFGIKVKVGVIVDIAEKKNVTLGQFFEYVLSLKKEKQTL